MSNDVHVGHDGWLFLAGGSNEVLRFYEEPNFFDDAGRRWLELARTRCACAKERGLLYRHMVVPDKLSIYPHLFALPLAYPENAPSLALPRLFFSQSDADQLAPLLIDVRSSMTALPDEQMLYWKTDAHWTFEGCWQAYLALCESVGANPNFSCLEAPEVAGDLLLDLGSKLNPPVMELYIVKLFNKGAERIFANSLVEYKERENAHDQAGLHVGSHIVLKNTSTATDPRTIVLFGDSYSEYRLHQLTGLLAETFAGTHFIWNSAIDWNYVDRVGAQIVVTEMAERFHNLVPSDTLNVEAFAMQRLEEHLVRSGKSPYELDLS